MGGRNGKQADPRVALYALDREIEQERQHITLLQDTLDQRREYLRGLRSARAELRRSKFPRQRRMPRLGPVTAAQRAGRGNVEAALTSLRRARRLDKPEIGRRMAIRRGLEKINDGTVSYAIQALVDDGLAREVGVEDGHRVYEYVTRSRSTVTRPGDR